MQCFNEGMTWDLFSRNLSETSPSTYRVCQRYTILLHLPIKPVLTHTYRACSFLKPFTGVRKALVITLAFKFKISSNMHTSLWGKRPLLSANVECQWIWSWCSLQYSKILLRTNHIVLQSEGGIRDGWFCLAGANDGCYDFRIRKGFGWIHVSPNPLSKLFDPQAHDHIQGYGITTHLMMTRKETTGMAKTSHGSVANEPYHLLSSTTNKILRRWTMVVDSCPPSFDLMQQRRLGYLSNFSMRWRLGLSCLNGRILARKNLHQTLAMVSRAFQTRHVNIHLPRMKRRFLSHRN